jgi:hypothetical protein
MALVRLAELHERTGDLRRAAERWSASARCRRRTARRAFPRSCGASRNCSRCGSCCPTASTAASTTSRRVARPSPLNSMRIWGTSCRCSQRTNSARP